MERSVFIKKTQHVTHVPSQYSRSHLVVLIWLAAKKYVSLCYAGTPKASGPRPVPNSPADAESPGQSSEVSPSPTSKTVAVDEDGWETVVGKKPAKSNKRQQAPRGYQGRR